MSSLVAVVFVAAFLFSPACNKNESGRTQQTTGMPQSEEPAQTAEGTMTNENINFAELRDSLHDRAIIDHLGVFDLRTLPILPDAWPTNGKVRIYGYRMQSLPTGTVQYRVWSSSHCVTIDLKMRETSLHSLGSDSILGDIADIDDTRVSTRRKLEDGEAALLAVCTGADPEEMRPRLATYLEWLDVVPVLGEEMKGHAPEFFRWLEDSARGTESR